ncbi:MAG TPA: hypothetical protein DEB06_03375 [Phycisphaerales bacterium]|nr:hypothetical protein [Phycisphaerales bacterium]
MQDHRGGQSVCDRIAGRVATRVGRSRFERYFKGVEGWRLVDGRLSVRVPTPFYGQWLDSRFGHEIREAASAEAGGEFLGLDWTVTNSAPVSSARQDGPGVETREAQRDGAGARQDDEPDAGPPASPRGDHPQRARSRRATHRPIAAEALRGSLDDFVVGSCNRLAYNAALRLCDRTAEPVFQLLVLHGDCGVGKTHLLQGLARAFAGSGPGARVRYLTGEAFTNEYVTAVRSGALDAFRAGLRRLDLLCVDDAHFVAGKASTQQELLHTFEALDLSGARVAIASDAHPRDLAELNKKLASRFLGGMVVRIEPPDRATRLAIVSRRAGERGIRLDPVALAMIADRSEGSVRDLLGALARVDAMAVLLPALSEGGEGGVIGPALVRHALGGGASPNPTRAPARPVRVAQVVGEVAEAVGVDPSDVLGHSRHRRVVLARSIAAYLARQVTTMSFPEIAQAMQRPNHSTIVTAVQRVARQIRAGAVCEGLPGRGDEPLADLCARLRRGLTGATDARA